MIAFLVYFTNRHFFLSFLITTFLLFVGVLAAKNVKAGNSFGNRYEVLFRYDNNKYETALVYKSSAGNGTFREWGLQKGKSVYYSNVELDGKKVLSIIVRKIGSQAKKVTIRPTRKKLSGVHYNFDKDMAQVSFNITDPSKLSIEFDDDDSLIEPFFLFINKEQSKDLIPDSTKSNVLMVKDSTSLLHISSDKNIIYFGKGLHRINQWIVPKTVKQIYLAKDAVVFGYLYCLRNELDPGIIINGRGILSNSGWPFHYPSTHDINLYESNTNWYKSISIIGGKNHLIEGITIVDPTSYCILINSNNSKISNVKIHGFRMNNDGITLAGDHLIIEDCFIRVNDDSIVPYCSNLTVSNSIFWQLSSGSIFQFGWMPHSMHNIAIENCDVIHADWKDSDVNSGFVNAMGTEKNSAVAFIDNVKINNIYFDTAITRFLSISRNRYNSQKKEIEANPAWVYRGFSVKNIFFKNGSPLQQNLIQFQGYSSSQKSSNILFENIFNNGKRIEKNDFLNRYSSNLTNIVDLNVY